MPAAPGFFDWGLSYSTVSPPPTHLSEDISFSHSYSLFFLNCAMYVCVEVRFDFLFTTLLVCGDDKCVNIYSLLYVFCFQSKTMLYSFVALDWHALIGLVLTRHCSCLISV
ncbi:hypothetical protein QYE76_059548 [Lolium multiflorum]|uniref:Uncharacterized protein n=1 Tax=Lolium multiflorum TaxID=4521 RepID=A0AAD8RX73_LOLMU|nr:hypothetical protein QYE76_059541 [Lolium multiflorum]KAK1641743.1 hypothetical protein QYE76_059548 [Lolium multiflorum]